MPDSIDITSRSSDLRLRAAARLGGSAGEKSAPVRAGGALAVLYELASSPATAADALALLHELQVHQVELELQAEELRESRVVLESALSRQIELYDFQPIGCFTVDAASVIHELNLAGARMLGVGRDEAQGLPLESFLTLDSRRALRELISRVGSGNAYDTSTVRVVLKDDPDRLIYAHVSPDPAGQRFLLALASAGRE